jgi:hypothetical protein
LLIRKRELLHGLPGASRDHVGLRALIDHGGALVAVVMIHHDGVRIGDVCDVRGLVDDRGVLRTVHDDIFHPWGAELPDLDEHVVPSADPEIGIDVPTEIVAVAVDPGLGRERGPSDVVVAIPPRNPGGSPLGAGHPHPANAAEFRPAAVMIGGPAEALI